MKRILKILSVVVACELVAAGLLLAWPTPFQYGPQPPRPDLSHLDSMTVREIHRRQQRVHSGRAADWQDLAEIYVLYGHFAEAVFCCQRSAEMNPESYHKFST